MKLAPLPKMAPNSQRLTWFGLFSLLLLLVFSGRIGVLAQSIVETLPGYPGKLPFKLETGYVSVGDLDDVELFYYFIESERNPVRDPLVLWLTGGPGCSGFTGLVYEIGPMIFDYAAFNGSLPTIKLNPYSWTQVASIIFLDAPVGTGFSYSKTSDSYYTSDTKSAKAIYNFIRKWLMDHPKYSNNPFYVAGDSYSGVIVPMVTLEISNGNEAGLKPFFTLQGYMLGNPVTYLDKDKNARVPYAHRVALLSDELYESVKSSCNGEYVNPDPSNAECVESLELVTECLVKVNDAEILEPKCSFASPKANSLERVTRFFDDIPIDAIELSTQRPENWCRNQNYVLSYLWANDQSVQEALHIRNGTITNWNRCNKSLSYDFDIDSVVDYHRVLNEKGCRALVYSGDHDMLIPYIGTQAWINYLNMTIVDVWRPWFVNGQVAGYTEKYAEYIGDGFTFATVKGGGHTAPEYKPEQCLEMIDRWFSYYAL